MRHMIPAPSSCRFGAFSLTMAPDLFSAGSFVTHLPRPHLIIETPREDYANFKRRYGYVSALPDSPDSGYTASPFQATIASDLFSDLAKPMTSTNIPGFRTNRSLVQLGFGRGISIRWKVHFPFFLRLLLPLANVNDPPTVNLLFQAERIPIFPHYLPSCLLWGRYLSSWVLRCLGF